MLKYLDKTALRIGITSIVAIGYLSTKKLKPHKQIHPCLSKVPKVQKSIIADHVAKYHVLNQMESFQLLCQHAEDFLTMIENKEIWGREWTANRLTHDIEVCIKKMCHNAQGSPKYASIAVELALDNSLLTTLDTVLYNELL